MPDYRPFGAIFLILIELSSTFLGFNLKQAQRIGAFTTDGFVPNLSLSGVRFVN